MSASDSSSSGSTASSSSSSSSLGSLSGPYDDDYCEGRKGAGYGTEYEELEILRLKKVIRDEKDPNNWNEKGYAQLPVEALEPPTDTIERVDEADFTPKEFAEQYEIGSKCCIITGVGKDWSAWEDWQLDNLLEKYGNKPFDVGSSEHTYISLAKFVHYTETNDDDCPLYIFEPRYDHHYPNLLKGYSIPRLFPNDYMKYMGRGPRPYYRWILMGGPRTGGGMHIDPNYTCAWNTLLTGRKRWILFPPETKKRKVFFKKVDDNSITWFNEVYPNLDEKTKSTAIEFVQHAGETVFLAAGWWHCVMNLEWSVCVTANYVSDSNFEVSFEDLCKKKPRKGRVWYSKLPRRLKKRVNFDPYAQPEVSSVSYSTEDSSS